MRITIRCVGQEEGRNFQEEERVSQREGKIIREGGSVSQKEGKINQEKVRGEVQIENSGVTIPEELLPHIFEPFVSGTNGVSDMGTSSHGLGLYIASYYAKKLGFSLTIQNGEACVIATLLVNVLG